jgi:adenylate cyclase
VDRVLAQGKTEAVTIYQVLCVADTNRCATGARWTDGLVAYRAGDFHAALDHFGRCLDAFPEDGAAALYVDRCEGYLRRGPPTGWDGVTRLTAK